MLTPNSAGLGYLHIVKSQQVDAREFELYGFDNVTLPVAEGGTEGGPGTVEGVAVRNIFNMTSRHRIPWPMLGRQEKYVVFCIDRFVLYWGEFLRRPDAKQDPQFATIKHIYDTAVNKFVDSNSQDPATATATAASSTTARAAKSGKVPKTKQSKSSKP